MGYMRLHAIVVSGSSADAVRAAHEKAKEIFSSGRDEGQFGDPFDNGRLVSKVTPEGVNGYSSFLVAPDGSKEWWDASNRGDELRDEFVRWLRQAEHPVEGGRAIYLDWVEIQYGDDERETRIVRHSDDL